MDPLALPVGMLARGFEPIHAEDSVDRAVAILRSTSSDIAPVVENGRYIGVISERTLTHVLANSFSTTMPAAEIVETVPTILTSATGAEALRKLDETGVTTLVVLNPDLEPVGLLSASDLFPRPVRRPVPPLIGGMATPFGVYLTTGSISGGVSQWALVGTGAVMSFLFLVADAVFEYLAPHIPSNQFTEATAGAIPLIIFMALMRAIPLSGTHAAEHQVVHALERGEELDPEVVRRMPRVHPRCGTNLAVGLMIFLGLLEAPINIDFSIRALFAALISLMTYRSLGGIVQWAVTTKPANRKQIQSGIAAAEDLLNKYATKRRQHATFLTRIVNMGILHVMVGASATTILAHYIAFWLHLPVSW
jgi:CBS domain-containing protein